MYDLLHLILIGSAGLSLGFVLAFILLSQLETP